MEEARGRRRCSLDLDAGPLDHTLPAGLLALQESCEILDAAAARQCAKRCQLGGELRVGQGLLRLGIEAFALVARGARQRGQAQPGHRLESRKPGLGQRRLVRKIGQASRRAGGQELQLAGLDLRKRLVNPPFFPVA